MSVEKDAFGGMPKLKDAITASQFSARRIMSQVWLAPSEPVVEVCHKAPDLDIA